MTEALKKDKKTILFEFAYYLCFSIAIFVQFMDTTLIKIGEYRTYLKFTLLFLGIVLVAKIACEWTKAWDCKAILIGIVCVGGLLISTLKYQQDFTIVFCLLILAARRINSNTILKIYVIISVILTGFVVVFCLNGYVRDFTVYRDALSTVKRHSYGFAYPTYFSAHIMGICTVWAFVRGKAYSWIEIALTVLIGFSTYKLTDARITCAVIIGTAIIMAVNKVCLLKNIKLTILRKKFIQLFLIGAAGFVAFFSWIMGILYNWNVSFVAKLDNVLSGRIHMIAVALKRYDITLWGERVVNFETHYENEKGVDDAFFLINNSYMQTLLYLGIICLISILIGWMLISYRTVLQEEYYKLFILDSLVVYSFFEQRLLIFCIVPFWFLLLSDKDVIFWNLSKTKIYKFLINNKKKIWLVLSMACLAFMVDVIVFNKDAIMSCMSETIDTKEYDLSVYGFKEDLDGKLIRVYDELKEGDSSGILLSNIFSPIGVESFNLGLNFYEVKGDDYHYIEDVDYSYDIFSIGDDGAFYKIKTVECNSSNVKTNFTSLDIDTFVVSLYVMLHYDEKYLIDVMKLDINGPVPYDFNPGRLALIWLILSALALVLSSGKKPEDKENDGEEEQVKEDTVENTEAEASKVETEVNVEAEKV